MGQRCLFLFEWYNILLYSTPKSTYKENSSTQTLSKILDSTTNISNEVETQSIPDRLKNNIETATNHVKNLVKDIGDLSQLPTEQKTFFLYNNSNLV